MDAVYRFILTCLKPFVIWFGSLYAPFTRKKVTGKHYYLLRDEIEVGTVLLTVTEGEFSNLINPEKLKHAGTYVGNILGTGVRYVIEAVGKGVVLTDLVTFLTTKDLVVGCKPLFLTEEDKQNLPKEAKKLVGIPYDYLFSEGAKALYCFETSAYIFKLVRPEIILNHKEVVKGKEIYSYETFLSDDKNFKVVFESDKV